MMIAGFCFYCHVVMLHVGTHYYLVWMQALQKHIQSNSKIIFPNEKLSSTIGEGSLHDVMADALGFKKVDMKILDKMALIPPGIWFVCVILTKNLKLWTKCMLCVCFLALGKGLLGFMTVIPDSIGFSECEARLGKEGITVIRDRIDFENDPVDAIGKLFALNSPFGLTEQIEVGDPPRMVEKTYSMGEIRYCADMMYSGHTWFVVLFCLATYEIIRILIYPTDLIKDEENKKGWRSNKFLCFGLYCTCVSILIALVATEVVLVIRNRFHYTMDVFVAIVLVFLYYTNAWIIIIAESWENLLVEKSNSRLIRGEVMVPICCCPFTCFSAIRGKWFIYERKPKFLNCEPRRRGSRTYQYTVPQDRKSNELEERRFDSGVGGKN